MIDPDVPPGDVSPFLRDRVYPRKPKIEPEILLLLSWEMEDLYGLPCYIGY
jgi:hypothetical protein